MKRRIYGALLDWKNDKDRKPLILRGARQIGKTFIVNQFGEKEFKEHINLNFERNPEYKEIFTTNNPNEILAKIAIYTGKKIVPNQTLIFLDEIQDCPKALMALRYFYEELPQVHIIGAGSLLEFALEKEDYRMPVGRVQYLYMYPLSFSEFLVALGEEPLQEFVSDIKNLSKVPEKLHEKLIDYTRKYFMVGGMPAVVKSYIADRDMLKCQKIQQSIISTYKDDFAKYAKKVQFKYLQKVFSTIPAMIGQKVVYSRIDNTVKARELNTAFDLLETAGVIHRVKKASGAGIPLAATAVENYYKPLFLDVGLMHAINGIYGETIRQKNLNDIFKGAVAEQFVGQELLALSNYYTEEKLYYWTRDAKNSHAEIDYLIVKNEEIIPVEVKSGKKGKLKSLLLYLDAYKPKMALKISQASYHEEDEVLSIPFYGVEAFLGWELKM